MADQETDTSDSGIRAKRKLERDMGPLMLAALHDPKTVEILLNADGRLWLERLGEPMKCIGTLRSAQGEAIIRTVASCLGKTVTATMPIVEGELPLDGSRFAGQLPPIVAAPTFAIRKKAIAIFTLEQYLEAGIMSRKHYDAIRPQSGTTATSLSAVAPDPARPRWSTRSSMKWCFAIPSSGCASSRTPGRSSAPPRTTFNITRPWKCQ